MKTHQLKKMALAVVFLISITTNYAQRSIEGSVKTEHNEALAFATVVLMTYPDSTFVKGGLSTEEGKFSFEGLAAGQYLVRVSSLGYLTYCSLPLTLTTKPLMLPDVILKAQSTMLDEVVIQAQRAIYEQQIDRLVINVQNMITATGGSVLEVLQKSPGVLINRQNNSITLNGKSGIQFMFNNKINRLPADAIIQMLNGMSASNVEKIELITTPPAQYDAEGTGGIIHILSKSQMEAGTEGTIGSYSLSGGYSNALVSDGSFNIQHRKGKTGIFFDYTVNYDGTDAKMAGYRTLPVRGFQSNITTSVNQIPDMIVQNGSLGLEYALTPKTNLNLMMTGYQRNWFTKGTPSYNEFTAQPDSIFSTYGNQKESNIWNGVTLNLGIGHQLTKNQSLSFDADYIYYWNIFWQDYEFKTTHVQSQEKTNLLIDVDKRTPLDIIVAKADYRNQLSPKIELNGGIKLTRSTFENDVRIAYNTLNQWQVDTALTNIADLKEQIYAAYVSASLELPGGISLNTGLRYEYTDTYLSTLTQKGLVNRQRHYFFPSVFARKPLNPETDLQASYGRRITRPTFNDMAPFVFFSDPYSFISGNPALKPAITDTWKIDLKRRRWLFSFQYSDTKDEIAFLQPIVDAQTNRQISYSNNMEYLRTWSLTTAIPMSPTQWWEVQTNLTATYLAGSILLENVKQTIENKTFTANINNSITLPAHFTLELSGYYQSGANWGVFKFKPLGSVNAGLMYKLKNKNGTLRLAVNDIFRTNIWNVVNEIPSIGLENHGKIDWHFQSIRLTYTHRFGKDSIRKVEINSGADEEKRRLN